MFNLSNLTFGIRYIWINCSASLEDYHLKAQEAMGCIQEKVGSQNYKMQSNHWETPSTLFSNKISL